MQELETQLDFLIVKKVQVEELYFYIYYILCVKVLQQIFLCVSFLPL